MEPYYFPICSPHPSFYPHSVLSSHQTIIPGITWCCLYVGLSPPALSIRTLSSTQSDQGARDNFFIFRCRDMPIVEIGYKGCLCQAWPPREHELALLRICTIDISTKYIHNASNRM